VAGFDEELPYGETRPTFLTRSGISWPAVSFAGQVALLNRRADGLQIIEGSLLTGMRD
jgi:hypothetical protein